MDNQRSPKVRKLLGEIPPSLVRAGMIIIIAITLALVVAAILLWPHLRLH